MPNDNAFSHLSLEERRIILTGIINGSTKTAIAKTIGKDNSTVGKEIKKHRILKHKCNLPMECSAYRKCVHGRNCTPDCPEYIPFSCSRRDRSPGACNGCSGYSKCRFNKFMYSPEAAQADYRNTLVDARQGVNMTSTEAAQMAAIVAPLLKQGMSPYQILQIHPELKVCEKTLYNYIEGEVFHHVAGITVMDLRRQVSRRLSKKKIKGYKKRQDRKFLNGRLYHDFQAYFEQFPDAFITQMDTVYNSESGPFLQTFLFCQTGIMLAFLHEEKTASAMLNGVNMLESILGTDCFRKYVHILLTDRGSEFSAADAIETSEDGTRRTRLFYCDPMQSGQKGSLENKHIMLRYILPKGTDLRRLGLVSQDDLNLVVSHINSAPLEKLGGKSPLDLTAFMYPDLYEKLLAFGISPIEKQHVILKHYLLKRK